MKRLIVLFQILACLFLIFASPVHAAKSSVQTQYDRAVRDMKSFMDNESKKKYRSHWEKHIDAFLSIAKKNPKSSVADDALLSAGEGYLNLYHYSRGDKDIDKAEEIFEQLIAKYPNRDTADNATYRLGEIAFNYRQDISSALSRFDRLVKAYPKSRLVKDARKMADKIAVQLEQESAKKVAAKNRDVKISNAPPPPDPQEVKAFTPDSSIKGLTFIRGIRHWSNDTYTRVVVDLDNGVSFDKNRLYSPDRLYFDLHNARLEGVEKDPLIINDGILRTARMGQFTSDTVRVVLDLDAFQTYQIFPMENPNRLVIDVVAKGAAWAMEESPSGEERPAPAATAPEQKQAQNQAKPNWKQRNWQKVQEPPSDAPSLARQLGLGVRRIVIDAGHGGSDPGAIGPSGLREKDVVLDIALRLERLLKAELTDEVILTRRDDTFVQLEERTAIANKNKADLFISVHANASRRKLTRGIETYILNLTSNKDAIEVAARENQASMKTMSDMGGILKDIMRTAKKDESLHLAHHVQKWLLENLSVKQEGIMNLGVKEAPFYVLIGAQMPSILAEVGFISNPTEEQLLASEDYRQEIALALLRGIREYVNSVAPKVAVDENQNSLVGAGNPTVAKGMGFRNETFD